MSTVVRQPGFFIKGSQIENRVQKPFVFNEAGDDIDFRIEGAGDGSLFFVNAGTDKIGFGTQSPAEKLEVIGNFQVSNADTATKNYRFRTSGSDLDLDGAGSNLLVSMYSTADFAGTQRFYLNFSSGSGYADAFLNWIFHNAIFGPSMFAVRDDNGEVVVNDDQGDYNFRIEGDTTTHLFFTDAGLERVAVGTGSPTAKLHIDQPSTTGAVPVLLLDQADVSEEFIRFIGTSTTDASQSLVDAANLTTPGSIVGWFKIYVQDDQGTGPITDGIYYVPFYTSPTA